MFLLSFVANAVLASGYKDTVVAPKGWADGLDRIAVFVTQGNEVINSSEVESQVESTLAATRKLPFRTVVSSVKMERLMAMGLDRYDDSRRAEALTALGVSAVLLIDIPHAGQSQFGKEGAEVHVILRVVAADGKILMRGESSGKAWNTASSPENIARHAILRVLGKATGLNLD
ncbi:MAG: hypothetical protein ABI639_02895 [Thermoanaerobaculia bacterium]